VRKRQVTRFALSESDAAQQYPDGAEKVEGSLEVRDVPSTDDERAAAYFSDRGRLFQADRGRRIGAVDDALGKRASSELNISQSSTISLKRAVVEPVKGRCFGRVDF